MSASTERKNRQAARAAGTDKKTLAAQEAAEKARKSKRKWTVGTIAVVLCIALVLFLSSSMFYRTVTAESVGSRRLSVAEANYFIGSTKNSMSYDLYVTYFGQEYADQILAPALENNLIQSSALLQYAKDNGITLTAQEKAGVKESVDVLMEQAAEVAKQNSISTSAYLNYVYGKGVNKNVICSGLEDNLLAQKAYFSKFIATTSTPEERAAYYEDPSDADLFTYAVYQVTVDDSRTKEEAKTAAEELVHSYNDNRDADPDPLTVFNDILAEEYDGASVTERTDTGASLEGAYALWLKGPSRNPGDAIALEATDGNSWYVVVFLGRDDNTEPTVAVRHILVMVEPSEDGTYSDEAKEAAKAKAEGILADWEAGENTEADFATLAYLYSDDTGSRSNGGMYSTVTQGQMVPEFDAFCFEEHEYGDTTLVYVESSNYAGYHIIYFVERTTARDAAARDALRSAAMTEWLTGLTEGLEIEYHWAYKLVG